ncbi:MAG: DUF2203 domain-containing protein [Pirellulaceae bacterium]
MSSSEYKPTRLFTIEQANAMLPLVRAITSDLASLARDVVERRHRVALLTAGRELKKGDPYGDELAQIEQDLQLDGQRLVEYMNELKELGVEPKGAVDGLVDFPAEMDGRIVFLCWKLGEAEVLHWHDLEGGFAGRQSLVAGVSHADDADEFAAE